VARRYIGPLGIARLGTVAPRDWFLYADGYQRAAEMLVASISTTYELNTVVFPVIYLYRHYLELTLKEIIGYCRYLDSESHPITGTHDLKRLWTESQSLLKRHVPDLPAAELDTIATHVNTLAALDPTSEASRYPLVKGGGASFDGEPDSLDLDELAVQMKELAELLHAVTSTLAVYQDYESEMRSYYDDAY